ncbi:Conjugative transfer protein TrbG (plasmid) [Acidisarcina polymorpha]|uniref:Conjugative transfer protein TrbG n=1 Tax=Acidisarcina polymorpha TaxID=2211140 RepID=A0A2Z5GCT2_9BACT|nr:P-type conjugative transfer protein TrbG [Acidisarcina polymorpha]AXC16435.1 Conjugative transfer protein TrbG [Acidisarcina polymorpha]
MIGTFFLAAQIAVTAGQASSSPGLDQQHKQELSQYPLKSAVGALSATGGSTAAKPNASAPLAPIPPLQVPPLVKASPPSSQGTGARANDKGSAVPLGWKPPHSELTETALKAAVVSENWQNTLASATAGSDGRVLYIFGQGMPVLVCAPLRVCAVELQAGEHLQSPPQLGDTRRWEITPVMSGGGLDTTPLLVVKPVEPGLETDLIIPTDRRTYVIKLISDSERFVSRMAFEYPSDVKEKWASFQAQQDAAKHEAEILAEQEKAKQEAKDKAAGVVPLADNAIDNLYFDYKVSGDPAYAPERILDDGQHTYLIYPDDHRFRELPTLLMVVHGKTELLNFRVDGSRYIVDRLFDKALLVVGVGKKQAKVTITRGVPYRQGNGNDGAKRS